MNVEQKNKSNPQQEISFEGIRIRPDKPMGYDEAIKEIAIVRLNLDAGGDSDHLSDEEFERALQTRVEEIRTALEADSLLKSSFIRFIGR